MVSSIVVELSIGYGMFQNASVNKLDAVPSCYINILLLTLHYQPIQI